MNYLENSDLPNYTKSLFNNGYDKTYHRNNFEYKKIIEDIDSGENKYNYSENSKPFSDINYKLEPSNYEKLRHSKSLEESDKERYYAYKNLHN